MPSAYLQGSENKYLLTRTNTEESTWSYNPHWLLQQEMWSFTVADITVNYGYLTGSPENQPLSPFGAWEPAVQTPQGVKSLQNVPHSVGTSHVMPTS